MSRRAKTCERVYLEFQCWYSRLKFEKKRKKAKKQTFDISLHCANTVVLSSSFPKCMSDLAPPIVPSYIPFDHTYILYDPNDIVSIISVQFSLLPIYIMVFYLLWFLVTREIEPVIVVGGHLCSEILNKILKKILKSPRPDFHKEFGNALGKALSSGSGIGAGKQSILSYGMPSAHSQFVGFLAAYYSCVIIFRIEHFKKWQKQTSCALLLCMAVGVASSRVYLQYHTWQQVVVGVVVGNVFGLLYFIVSMTARDIGLVDWVLNWPIVKLFYVKDSYFHCYQSFRDEYEAYIDQKSKSRQFESVDQKEEGKKTR